GQLVEQQEAFALAGGGMEVHDGRAAAAAPHLHLADVGLHELGCDHHATADAASMIALPSGKRSASLGMTSDANSSRFRRVRSAGSVPSWKSPSRLPVPRRRMSRSSCSYTVSGEPTMAYWPSTTWSHVSRFMAKLPRPLRMFSTERN